ncbi:hypothetical protein A0J61_09873, partial [Choanephora cucurbitarum]
LSCLSKQDKSRIRHLKATVNKPVKPSRSNSGNNIYNFTSVNLSNVSTTNESKKRKIDFTNDDQSWPINSQEDIWEAWKQYLETQWPWIMVSTQLQKH